MMAKDNKCSYDAKKFIFDNYFDNITLVPEKTKENFSKISENKPIKFNHVV